MSQQRGFSIVEVIVVLAVVAVGAFVGYQVWQTYFVEPDTTSQQSTQQATDIEAVSSELDSITIDDAELDQLDAELTY